MTDAGDGTLRCAEGSATPTVARVAAIAIDRHERCMNIPPGCDERKPRSIRRVVPSEIGADDSTARWHFSCYFGARETVLSCLADRGVAAPGARSSEPRGRRVVGRGLRDRDRAGRN